LSKVKEK